MPVVERVLSTPANQQPYVSPIAGSVLPIRRAEELLATLPGVIAARIVASELGSVEEIHVLTSAEFPPKQTVRNIESALIAHLGMKVDHRKISVATTIEPDKAREAYQPRASEGDASAPVSGRRLYFEDIEVRRSRAKGVACRVTLRMGEASFIGESEGVENERSRIELAARAALSAILQTEEGDRLLSLDGCKMIDAFEREWVFVGVTARWGRESAILAGSCEIKESPETAAVLAVLDATNRWIDHAK